VFYELESMMIG